MKISFKNQKYKVTFSSTYRMSHENDIKKPKIADFFKNSFDINSRRIYWHSLSNKPLDIHL